MKSAYELALERLEKEQGPARTLTESQRARISELESVYAARVAERRLEMDTRIATAPPAEVPGLQEQLATTLQSIEQELADKKDAIWNEGQ